MTDGYEVLVVGAGPAGSIAALLLARAGVRVRMLDRARFPREKLCGDTVNPGALAILGRLGIEDVTAGALPVDGMIVTGASGVRCRGSYGGGQQGRALSRHALDAALLAAAARAGASVEEGVLVQGPVIDDGRVAGVMLGSNGAQRAMRAPIVIAADGAQSRLARALDLSHHARRPRRWAIGAYFEQVDGVRGEAMFGEMHLRERHYIGIAPLPGGVTNACVVTADRTALRDPGQLLTTTLRGDRELAPRFARARQVTRLTCLGPLAVDNVDSGVPGLLLAGDAAGFVDPMTGDGLRFAFRGAELAAEAALLSLENRVADPHVWLMRARRREFGVKWRFNRTLRMLAGSPLALRVAGSAASIAPRLVEQAVRYAGDVPRPPRDAFRPVQEPRPAARR